MNRRNLIRLLLAGAGSVAPWGQSRGQTGGTDPGDRPRGQTPGTDPRDRPGGQSAIATTRAGKLRGRIDHGSHVFRGIYYGADTSKQRFLPPVAIEPWTGVRDALEFGAVAPQPSSGGRPISENCLHLNVWTPALRDRGKRPVMVWFHGGAFSSGTSNE